MKPGYYWMRSGVNDEWEVVEITEDPVDPQKRKVYRFGMDDGDFMDWLPYTTSVYVGPIEPPKD